MLYVKYHYSASVEWALPTLLFINLIKIYRMKVYLFIFSFFTVNLFAQQSGFTTIVPHGKLAFPLEVIELSNKNYLCIVSNLYDTLVRNTTKLVVLSPKGRVLDSIIFSAPDKNLNAFKAVSTTYGLCLIGTAKKDTSNYLWVVNLNQQLQIVNEQFKSVPKEVIDISYALDRHSTIILSIKYKFDLTVPNGQGKINKKGEIMFIKNVFGLSGLSYSNTILVRKDGIRYSFLFRNGHYDCDTSFNNRTLHEFIDIPNEIAFRFISAPEIRIKNDSTYMFAGDCSRGSYLTNAVFAVTQNSKYIYFKETAVGGDTSRPC